jgi:tetratricopeptide (TPR) repeat protein
MVAVLLHTEAVLLSRREESSHLKAVRQYLEGMQDADSRRAFMRNWFLAVSQGFQKSRRYDSAIPLLQAARKAFPEDLEIQMAIASAWEIEGCNGRDRMLGRAEKEYRSILQNHPDHIEAHLRLARVLQLRNRAEEATGEIHWVLDRLIDARTKFIAYIILGSIYNQCAEQSKEIATFRAAAQIDPHSQVAALALSHALQRAGDLAASRRVIEELLLGGESKIDHPDEWRRFTLYEHESLLDKMREEICR